MIILLFSIWGCTPNTNKNAVTNSCGCSNPSGTLGEYKCFDMNDGNGMREYRCRENKTNACAWEFVSDNCPSKNESNSNSNQNSSSTSSGKIKLTIISLNTADKVVEVSSNNIEKEMKNQCAGYLTKYWVTYKNILYIAPTAYSCDHAKGIFKNCIGTDVSNLIYCSTIDHWACAPLTVCK